MQAWVEGIDVAVWDAIEEGPYIPMHSVDGKEVEKNDLLKKRDLLNLV